MCCSQRAEINQYGVNKFSQLVAIMCVFTSYSQLFCTLRVGVGCDEGGGCNEVVMEVAMEVVMIKGDKDKTLFIRYYKPLHSYIIFYFICTADGCTYRYSS